MDQEFAEFRDTYMPLIRPEGLVRRVKHALQLDDRFLAEFQAIRKLLAVEIDRWPDQIMLQLMEFRDFSEKFSDADVHTLHEIFARHRASILKGTLEDDYFSSVEELTLFFIHHDIRAIWLVGAIKRTVEASMKRLYLHRDGGGRCSLFFAAMSFLILELNQVQRVFIRYSELVDAVEDATPEANITLAS